VTTREVSAYSEHTGRSYPTWDELVVAETNGFSIVSVSDRPGTVPAVYGPYNNREEARKARVRLHRRFKREESPHTVHTYVRHIWKETP
jgi:hypothetical protein